MEEFASLAGSDEVLQRSDLIEEQTSSSSRGVAVVFPVMAPPAPRGAPHGTPLTPVLPGAPASSSSASASASAAAAAALAAATARTGAHPPNAEADAAPASTSTSSYGSKYAPSTSATSSRRGSGSRVGSGVVDEETELASLTARASAATQAAEAQKALSAARSAKEAAERAAAAAAVAAQAARKDSDAESAYTESYYADSGFGIGTVPSTDLMDRVWKANQSQTRARGGGHVEMSMVSSATSDSTSQQGAHGERRGDRTPGGGGDTASKTSRGSKSSERSGGRRSSSRRKDGSGGGGSLGTPGPSGTPQGSINGSSQRRRGSRSHSRRRSDGDDRDKGSTAGSVTDSPSVLATPTVRDCRGLFVWCGGAVWWSGLGCVGLRVSCFLRRPL